MNYRDAYYGVYRDMECILLDTLKGWKLITSNDKAREYGFTKSGTKYSKIIEIEDKDLITAFTVRTKAKYNGFHFTLFQNENLKEENKVRLYLENLDFEAYDHFGFPYRNDDASIEVNEEELEEIWEERKPLSQFPFKAEKIKFIKKEGEFL
ncbi:hypothetical protein SAMN05421766_101572 [Zobellia uliginosa]|uniref:Uncharacterized protein n=1 Tax=Zobellia uliginosa TaxID=143224 RepID=A0ABY1KJ20_9FLAO|nr:hypothetical protein [Zobellia uliginosa]SIS40323.1 hypothetical protein SAMN05421766_101572 [Zobellia uliginosa]